MDNYTRLMMRAKEDPEGFAKDVIANKYGRQEVVKTSNRTSALSKEQAQRQLNNMLADPKHPLNDDRADKQSHDKAVDEMLSLYEVINGVIPQEKKTPVRSNDPQYVYTPEEAKNQLYMIRSDIEYLDGRLIPIEQKRRQALVDRLMEISASDKPGSIEGWVDGFEEKVRKETVDTNGQPLNDGSLRKSSFGQRAPDNVSNTYQPNLMDGQERSSAFKDTI